MVTTLVTAASPAELETSRNINNAVKPAAPEIPGGELPVEIVRDQMALSAMTGLPLLSFWAKSRPRCAR